MIIKFVVFAVLSLVSASCDREQQKTAHISPSKTARSKERSNRFPRNISDKSDELRATLESARTDELGELRNKALFEVALKALETEPAIAVEVINELPERCLEKDSLIQDSIKSILSKEGLDAATVWADSLNNPSDKNTAKGEIALLVAETDPEQVVTLLPSSSFTANGVDSAAEQILQTWINGNPSSAAAWVVRQPVGEAREAGLKVVISQWLQRDSSSALKWAARQNNPKIRSEAIQAVIGAIIDQPGDIRDALLESADSALNAEIGARIAEINQQNNIVPQKMENSQ